MYVYPFLSHTVNYTKTAYFNASRYVPWQAAGDANNGINLIQSQTNKRFRGCDSSGDGEDSEVSNQDNRRGSGREKIKKRGGKRICCHFSSILWRQTHSSGAARQIRHHWTAGMRPERRKTGELASKLPDKSIIQVPGDTSGAGGHRWLRGTGCQVQHTQRGCQGKLQCRNCSPESSGWSTVGRTGSAAVHPSVRPSCWNHITSTSPNQTSEVPFISANAERKPPTCGTKPQIIG